MIFRPGPACRFLVILAAVTLVSCVAPAGKVAPKGPGKDQNSDILFLKKELTRQNKALSKQNDELSRQNDELTKQNEKISTIEQKLSHYETILQSLNKKTEALKKTFVKKNASRNMPKQQKDTSRKAPKHKKAQVSKQNYTEPAALYHEAREYMLQDKHKQAAQLFLTYLKHYPDTTLANNAFYWLGECHYTTGEFTQAAEMFKKLIKRYPDGGKVPDALLKTAYAYLSLDDSDRAHHYLKLVVKQYPFTPAGEKAAIKLKEFQNDE